MKTVKQYIKRHCKRSYIGSLSHSYITKDRTKPYLAKLVKDLIKDYKENRD